jgi:hypothetical protein
VTNPSEPSPRCRSGPRSICPESPSRTSKSHRKWTSYHLLRRAPRLYDGHASGVPICSRRGVDCRQFRDPRAVGPRSRCRFRAAAVFVEYTAVPQPRYPVQLRQGDDAALWSPFTASASESTVADWRCRVTASAATWLPSRCWRTTRPGEHRLPAAVVGRWTPTSSPPRTASSPRPLSLNAVHAPRLEQTRA